MSDTSTPLDRSLKELAIAVNGMHEAEFQTAAILKTIRDEEHYREGGFTSFRQYMNAGRFDISHAEACRKIKCLEVRDMLVKSEQKRTARLELERIGV